MKKIVSATIAAILGVTPAYAQFSGGGGSGGGGGATIPSVPTTTPLTGTGSAGSAQAATGSMVLPNGTSATTQPVGTNTGAVATTAFVTSAVGSATPGSNVSASTATTTAGNTAITLANRFGQVFNPKDYGSVGDNGATTHTVNSKLGVTSLSGLAAVSGYSWVTNPVYGLTFSLSSNTAQGAAGTTLAYTPIAASSSYAPTGAIAASYNYAASSNVVLPGMTVSNGSGTSCIAANTTVSSVNSGIDFSVYTPFASAAGQPKIKLPFVGGLAIGMPIYTTAGGSTPIGTITAINSMTYSTAAASALNASYTYDQNATMMVGSDIAPVITFFQTTGGSNTATLNAGSTPTVGQIIAPTIAFSTSALYGLLYPPGTTITNISGTTITTSNPANLTSNSAYQQVFALSPPSITISANLSSAIAVGTQIFFGGVSQVVLNQATASACPANAAITYSYSTGSSGAGTVGGLDMDWLGMQSAVIGAAASNGRVEIPSGNYTMTRGVTIPTNSTNISINGAGRLSTILNYSNDEPRGACGLGSYNQINQYGIQTEYSNFSLFGPGGFLVIGGETAQMNGLCMNTGDNATDMDMRSFHSGFNITGNHQKLNKIQTSYNWYGIYIDAYSNNNGAQYFDLAELQADNFSNFGFQWQSGLDSGTMQNVHFGRTPRGFYKEGAPYGQIAAGWLTNYSFKFISSEAIGNEAIFGENGSPRTGVGDLIDNNTFISSSLSLSPSAGFIMPTLTLNALITSGEIKENVFLNSDMDGGGLQGTLTDVTELATCAVICGGAFPSVWNNSTIGENMFIGDLSVNNMVTNPGQPYNSIYKSSALSANGMQKNTFESSSQFGEFAPIGVPVSPGMIMQFYPDYAGSATQPYTAGGVVMGVANSGTGSGSTWSHAGTVAVVRKGHASVNYTNESNSPIHAVVSSTTPTSATTSAASDATSVVVGVWVGNNSGDIYVNPSP